MEDKRYFTVEEANSLVPALEIRFSKVMQLRAQLRSGYSQLETLGEMPWEIESVVFHDALVLSPDTLTVIETSIDPVRGLVEIASRPRANRCRSVSAAAD